MRERPEGLTCRTLPVAQNLRDGFKPSGTLERLSRLEQIMVSEIEEIKKLVK